MTALVIPELSDRVDELERQLRALRETPEDTIGSTNDFFIDNTGKVEGAAEGLATFNDTFTSAASYANYAYPLTTQGFLEANSEPTPAGLLIKASFEPAATQNTFLLYKGYRDQAGRNRCIDHIAILKVTPANTNNTKRFGNLCRFAAMPEAFQAWHSRAEGIGSVSHGFSFVVTSVYWSLKAKEQNQKQYGGKEGVIKWPGTFWIVSYCLNNVVVTSIWNFDPQGPNAFAGPMLVPSFAEISTQNIEYYLSGLMPGSASELGIGLIGLDLGDVINEWTIFPLSWR